MKKTIFTVTAFAVFFTACNKKGTTASSPTSQVQPTVSLEQKIQTFNSSFKYTAPKSKGVVMLAIDGTKAVKLAIVDAFALDASAPLGAVPVVGWFAVAWCTFAGTWAASSAVVVTPHWTDPAMLSVNATVASLDKGSNPYNSGGQIHNSIFLSMAPAFSTPFVPGTTSLDPAFSASARTFSAAYLSPADNDNFIRNYLSISMGQYTKYTGVTTFEAMNAMVSSSVTLTPNEKTMMLAVSGYYQTHTDLDIPGSVAYINGLESIIADSGATLSPMEQNTLNFFLATVKYSYAMWYIEQSEE